MFFQLRKWSIFIAGKFIIETPLFLSTTQLSLQKVVTFQDATSLLKFLSKNWMYKFGVEVSGRIFKLNFLSSFKKEFEDYPFVTSFFFRLIIYLHCTNYF